MTYERFYFGKLDPQILKEIDAEHKTKMKQLIEGINRGAWTEKQKKRQKSSIISNIALYRCFIDQGLPKDEAKELVKEYSFHIAQKAHKLLKTFFHIPGFFGLFRVFMSKGMSGDEIWKSEILLNDRRNYRVDVLKCLWADTCEFFECPELSEIFCLCDHIVFGNIKDFVFERSQTLGMNGEKCDFCFVNRKGKN
ncbi:L-2-amino-thiazoline-4-carboxylic acid hydrolase [Pseudoramibacter sp. HA2172]|uniref:L-2-amino-thiazoline-4-carboxylic acid hydrolase n=1 Tax=Pseudoramibacter faecis TaxID=3108534 RepID=UPI002E7A664F|nr:L-2-amino-thiazoline-4-carboxylic acid hydrolase [Pseudoramibacter sp. HA2172]